MILKNENSIGLGHWILEFEFYWLIGAYNLRFMNSDLVCMHCCWYGIE